MLGSSKLENKLLLTCFSPMDFRVANTKRVCFSFDVINGPFFQCAPWTGQELASDKMLFGGLSELLPKHMTGSPWGKQLSGCPCSLGRTWAFLPHELWLFRISCRRGSHSDYNSAGWSLSLSRHFIGIIWDKETAWTLAVPAAALLALLDADLYHGNSNVVSIAFNLFIFLLCFLLIFWHMPSLRNNKAVNGINSWSFKMGSRRLTRAKKTPHFSWQVNLFKVPWKLFPSLLYTGDAQQGQALQDAMQAAEGFSV